MPDSTPRGRSNRKWDMEDCYVKSHDLEHVPAVSLLMRVFFDSTRKTALFRLRAILEASRTPFYLQITPDQIYSLTLYYYIVSGTEPGSLAYLDFRLTAAVDAIIAPQGPLPELSANSDHTKLQSLRQLAEQCTLHVLLPTVPIGTIPACDRLRQL